MTTSFAFFFLFFFFFRFFGFLMISGLETRKITLKLIDKIEVFSSSLSCLLSSSFLFVVMTLLENLAPATENYPEDRASSTSMR